MSILNQNSYNIYHESLVEETKSLNSDKDKFQSKQRNMS